MTVNTSNIISGPYAGNGVTSTFSYTFRVDLKTQLSVYETDAAGVQTLLTVDTDYSVASLGVDAGGIITRVAGALPSGYSWYIRSNYQDTQLTAFDSQGGFFPDVHEAAVDKLTFQIQQISDQVGRAVRIDDADDTGSLVSLPELVPNKFLQVNATANGFDLFTTGTGVVTAEVPIASYDDFRDGVGFTIGDYSDGQIIWFTNSGIIGAFVLRTNASPADNGGTIIRSNVDTGRYVERANSAVVTPEMFGAVADGATDDIVAINKAAAFEMYRMVGPYAVGSSINIQNTTNGDWTSCKITALTNDFNVVSANSKENFNIVGKHFITGPGGAGSGVGLYLFECSRYSVDQPEVSGFQDGIILDGTAVAAGGLGGNRGRQGFITNPVVFDCVDGVQILRRAEYSVWASPQVTQCTGVGWTQEAGNTNVTGGNIQDNQAGCRLIDAGSTNANHGIFTGLNINHNIDYNLECYEVIEGYTFVGCHFYGDSSLTGLIKLTRSSGISIMGGIIDAVIEIDGDITPTATVSGWNQITGNQINTTYTAVNSVNSGREKTAILDNFTRIGDAWGINDRALFSMSADSIGGSQTLTTATIETIIFGNERDDNRGQYNAVTGEYTANQDQNVFIQSSLLITTTGTYTEGFAAIYIDAVAVAFFPVVSTNAANTSFIANGSLSKALTSSQVVTVRARIVSTGTITVNAAIDTNLTVHSTR